MADFVQTMKDWRRMCKTLGAESCEGCKLHADGNDCVAVYEGEMDYAKVEKAVTDWVAKNPEPVYPTWEQFIAIMYLRNRIKYHNIKEWEINEHIPAEIAQKLGLEPKEG